jgi:hypothetical protein
MSTVCFAYRPEVLPPGSNLSGRPEIFEKLRSHDIDPVISLGAESAFSGDGLRVFDLATDPDEHVVVERAIAIDALGLIVNRLDRSIRYAELPAGTVLPTMINENATRSLAYRKTRVWADLFSPLNLGIPTQLVQSARGIDYFLARHPDRQVVVKPDAGTNSRGVQVVDRDDLHQIFQDNPDWMGKQILQPALDFTWPFPPGIRAYDRASQDAFESLNQPGVRKELRIYGFHDPVTTTLFPVARAFEGEEQWFFVDPETVPGPLYEAARLAISRAAELTDARAVYGAFDAGYGLPPADPNVKDADPDWQAIEFNGKAPYLIGYDKHAGVADRLRDLFVNQIYQTIGEGQK